MSVLVRDLILSGIVYVILTYLTFRLMRSKKHGRNDDDGGLPFELTPPEIGFLGHFFPRKKLQRRI